MQEPPGLRHVVLVGGSDGLPGEAGWITFREAEHVQEPSFAVPAVVGEGLAGPFAGDQDTAACVAEVLSAVGLALARSRAHAFAGVFGLEAVTQPVRASRRARLQP